VWKLNLKFYKKSKFSLSLISVYGRGAIAAYSQRFCIRCRIFIYCTDENTFYISQNIFKAFYTDMTKDQLRITKENTYGEKKFPQILVYALIYLVYVIIFLVYMITFSKFII
jgi:hypothetical protein